MSSALHMTANSTSTRKVHVSHQTLSSRSERVKGLARENIINTLHQKYYEEIIHSCIG